VTGPAQPAPGWYPDPDGAAGMVRWWNGITWSDVTTPVGPGVVVQRSPVLAPPHAPELLTSDPEPAPPGRPRSPWLVPLLVLALVVVVVAGVLISRSGAQPTADAPPSSVPSFPSFPGGPSMAPPSFAPGTVRIIDTAAGISYPYLGEGWSEWAFGPQVETTQMAGQYFTTQEVTPDGTTFIAQCTSGPLAEGYGWSGPASLASTVTSVADAVRGYYYPQPNDRKVMRDEARTVDGHAAHLYEFQLSWHVPGYDSTGERAALLLIDVGKPAPALLYLSIPNTHAELYGVIDRVLAGVKVL
jgi:Protein of unknown function (DUF2510)